MIGTERVCDGIDSARGQPWHASCVITPAPNGAGARRRSGLEQGRPCARRGSTRVECRGTFGPFFVFALSAITLCARRRAKDQHQKRRTLTCTLRRDGMPGMAKAPRGGAFGCRRRCRTRAEQGGSEIPCRASALKR
ncbi:hypothetical protein TI01_1610 [Lysobacter sp. A03]|nr:hypothetical protein TI01_1610 [Lysobacter sp. A03]